MGRLTKAELTTAIDILIHPQSGDESDIFGAHVTSIEAMKELKAYKDLEEQGRLIEQKHGTWIPNKHMIRTPTAENYHCSECTQAGKRTSYCPHCGAKMKLKELEGVKE